VVIPHDAAKKIGNIDPTFSHGMGDFDYALRAAKLVFDVYLAPVYYGYYKRNPTIQYPKSIIKYLKMMSSTKMLPFKEQAIYAKRHAGPFWPIYVISPYIRAMFNLFFKR